MTRLDTIELRTSTDFIKSMDMNNFSVSKTSKPNGLEIVNFSLRPKKLGIEKVIVSQTFGTVGIKASSKVLGLNYCQGICIETLDQFIDEVNHTGIVLNKDFINDCELKYVDVKDDLKLNDNFDPYINTLNQLTAPKFIKTKYDSGIVFNEKVKYNPIRFTSYSKEYEMKRNNEFYKEYPMLINDFDNVLRIESRLPTSATIKKLIGSNKLLDILNSSNVNYLIFQKIINKQIDFKPFINTNNMTNAQEKNFAHIYYLNNFYNGDYHSIMKHIKSKLSKNTKPSYQSNMVKKYLAIINNSNANYNKELIEEIKSSLLN